MPGAFLVDHGTSPMACNITASHHEIVRLNGLMISSRYEMSVKANYMKAALNAQDLASWLRSERTAQGRSQAWIAARVGCRRQTIVDLEAGRNVELNALFGALAALGKGLAIVDARVDVERLDEVFRDED